VNYLITITKVGQMEIEAESEDEACSIAEDMEAEGSFFMNIEIDVERCES
jgi:hypothetical protein